ncbi:hypothetical protein NFI96_021528, partial [Prochilodus magdalenae]
MGLGDGKHVKVTSLGSKLWENRIQEIGAPVTLDSNTAHPDLHLSDDLTA